LHVAFDRAFDVLVRGIGNLGFEIIVRVGRERASRARGGANAWKSAWDSNTRRRQLPGSFSRGFDNPMFADSNVVAEEFGASSDDTV